MFRVKAGVKAGACVIVRPGLGLERGLGLGLVLVLG